MSLSFISGFVLGATEAARLQAAASTPMVPAASSTSRMLDIDDRVDRLVLVVQAMWALLEETGLSEEDLLAKIRELDLADGVEDGKSTRLPVTCSSCGSASPAGRTTCQLCGEPIGEPDPFSSV